MGSLRPMMVHTSGPLIFQHFFRNVAEKDIMFHKVEPNNRYTSTSNVEFELPASSAQYTDLRNSYLVARISLEQTDQFGQPISRIPGQLSTGDDDDLGFMGDDPSTVTRNSLMGYEKKRLPPDTGPSWRSSGRKRKALDPMDEMQSDGQMPSGRPPAQGQAVDLVNNPIYQDDMDKYFEDITLSKMNYLESTAMDVYKEAVKAFDQADTLTNPASKIHALTKAEGMMQNARKWMEYSFKAQALFALQSGWDDIIVPVDNVIHTMWKDVEMYLNHVKVSSSNNKYMYKAYLEALLNNSFATKKFQLKSQGFYGDNGNKDINFHESLNEGMRDRYNRFKNGKLVEMRSFLSDDVMSVAGSIPNAVHILLRLIPNFDNIRLQTFSKDPSKNVYARINLRSIWLMACKREFTNNVITSHDKIMKEISPATYPLRRSEVTVFNAKQGDLRINIENPYSMRVPARVIVGFTSARAYAGDFKLNPLRFQHYNIYSAGFYINNRPACKPPYVMDPKRGLIIDVYNELYSVLGKAGEDKDIGLTPTNYVNGHFLLPFDVSPTTAADFEYLGLRKEGNCSMEFLFSEPLPEDVAVIIYSIYPYMLSIDHVRNVQVDQV